MFFWNRKEILITFNPSIKGAVCDALTAAGIKYETTASTNGGFIFDSARRSYTGTFGENLNYIYQVFVSRSDYEQAMRIVKENVR